MKKKQTLSERFGELRNDTFAEIQRQMKRIGKDIIDKNGENGELAFLSYSKVIDADIIGISSKGELFIADDQHTATLYDIWVEGGIDLVEGGIDLNDFISLAEELQEYKV